MQHINVHHTYKKILILLCSVVVFFLHVATLQAATLSITPLDTSIEQGKTFSVTVRVNTEGSAVNVASADISYSTDKLDVVGVSAGSTFPVKTPGAPSVELGKVTFSAAKVSPGFSGANGILGRITFRARNTGTAVLDISSGQVLLNDGNATDALSGKRGATITITAPVQKEVVQKEVKKPAVVPVETAPATVTEAVTPVVTSIEPAPIQVTQATDVSRTVSATITIQVRDLLLLIYILIFIIVVLLIIIIVLIVHNHRKQQQVIHHHVALPQQNTEVVQVSRTPSAPRRPRKPRAKKPAGKNIVIETL